MSLTQEQIARMVELSAPLVADPLPWTALSDAQQEAFRLLMPRPSFGEMQRLYLSLWWLPVDQPLLDVLNDLMPPNNVLAAREDDSGGLWLCADLLSDALDDGRLAALLTTLETMPLTYRTAEAWPDVANR